MRREREGGVKIVKGKGEEGGNDWSMRSEVKKTLLA